MPASLPLKPCISLADTDMQAHNLHKADSPPLAPSVPSPHNTDNIIEGLLPTHFVTDISRSCPTNASRIRVVLVVLLMAWRHGPGAVGRAGPSRHGGAAHHVFLGAPVVGAGAAVALELGPALHGDL